LPSEQTGIEYKKKQDIINKYNQKENKSKIPYEYKVGDQVLLETPGILRKLSTPRTGSRMYTRMVQSESKKELYQKESMSVESIDSIKSPIKNDLGGE
jgi:hypothetical protein